MARIVQHNQSADGGVPVFLDPSGRRWQVFRVAAVSFLSFVAVLMTWVAARSYDHSALPELNLTFAPTQYARPSEEARTRRPRPASDDQIPRSAEQQPGLSRGPELGQLLPPSDTSAEAVDAGLAQQVLGRLVSYLGSIPSPVSSAQAAERAKPLRYAFLVNWDDGSSISLRANLGSIDVLVPEWLHLSPQGKVEVDDAEQVDVTKHYLAGQDSAPIVVPMVNNIWEGEWQGPVASAVLRDPERRSQIAKTLLSFVEDNGFAGITIDFEALSAGDMPAFEQFTDEVSRMFRPRGLQVNVAVPLYGAEWRLGVLAQSADALIVMGYDQHASRTVPGPVAAQSWLEKGLQARLEEVAASKLVLAVANYGYDWMDGEGEAESHTMHEVLLRAKQAGATIHMDADALNPTFEYYDIDNDHRTVWYLDAVTAYNQIKATEAVGLKGVALWRLGSEDPSIWPVFNHLDDLAAVDLSDINANYQIDYFGQGEVLKVVAKPKTGHRTIVKSSTTGLITDETIDRYPERYEIARWGATQDKKIALTFDDGPDPVYTPEILDILKTYHVPATFFVVGSQANKFPDLVRRIVDEGHEIGNHTFTHPDVAKISAAQLTMEVNATQRVIESITGRSTVLFRPPFAVDIEPRTVGEIDAVEAVSKMGYYTVNMYIDGNDWKLVDDPKRITQTILDDTAASHGNVALLHDAGGDRSGTVAALPRIIEALRAKGYTFVPLAELISRTKDQVMPPVKSTSLVELDAFGYGTVRVAESFLAFLFVGAIGMGISRSGLIALLAIRRRRKSAGSLSSHPLAAELDRPKVTVGVVVPAFNEEKVICKTLDSLLASSWSDLSILVVDDGSTDDTVRILRERYAGEPRIQVLTKSNGGKSEALNLGIAALDSDIIIALDADTIFLPDTVSNLVRSFDDPQIAAVAGNAKVGNRINLLTRWQALEYIIAQNLDRRAFERLNCITVVPGAIGAWRREVVLEVGGFGTDTLAEDADLTLRIIRAGHRVVYAEDAIALTEAPADIRSFLKQRFRWMYGMMQTAFKHKDALLGSKLNSVGLIALPNILIFQLIFPCIAPIADLYLIMSVVGIVMHTYFHPEIPVAADLLHVVLYYALFIVVDYAVAILAFCNERKENWTLLYLLILQRFFYRQLLYYVAIKTILSALRGRAVGWFKLDRLASVRVAPPSADGTWRASDL